jgi:hypothetical protein
LDCACIGHSRHPPRSFFLIDRSATISSFPEAQILSPVNHSDKPSHIFLTKSQWSGGFGSLKAVIDMAPSPPRLRILSGAYPFPLLQPCHPASLTPNSPGDSPSRSARFNCFCLPLFSTSRRNPSQQYSTPKLTEYPIVGGNAVSAFLSWRLQATNACDVTLVWKNGYQTVAQYGISFKWVHNTKQASLADVES